MNNQGHKEEKQQRERRKEERDGNVDRERFHPGHASLK